MQLVDKIRAMKPRDVYARIESVLGYSGSPIRIQTLLEMQLQEYFGLLPIEAAEKAETLEQPVRKLVQESVALHEENGTVSNNFTQLLLGSFGHR